MGSSCLENGRERNKEGRPLVAEYAMKVAIRFQIDLESRDGGGWQLARA
jgi:hypothetical protein